MKISVPRNFTKFTGKHLCQIVFFNKVASLRPATLLKKKLWRRCFLVNFAKFLRNTFFTEQLSTAASVLYGVKRLGIPTATLRKHLLLENRLW